MDGEYNTLQHVEVREKIGILGLYVATLQPGACMGSAAADVERMAIAAIYAAATPLLADVANLRSQAEATRAAAARERGRLRGNVDAWRTRAEAAEAALAAAQAERAEALAAARAEGEAAGRAAERAAVVAHLRGTGWSSLIAEAAVIEDGEHVAGPTFACCGEGA